MASSGVGESREKAKGLGEALKMLLGSTGDRAKSVKKYLPFYTAISVFRHSIVFRNAIFYVQSWALANTFMCFIWKLVCFTVRSCSKIQLDCVVFGICQRKPDRFIPYGVTEL